MDGKVEENNWNDGNELRAWKYSNNPVEEWKQLFKHVMEVFKKETIDALLMTMDAFVDEKVSIINFLKTNVKSVTECYLFQWEKKNDVDEHAAYLLENIKINNELSSFLHIKNGEFHGKIPKNLKELFIKHAEMIGYERLLEIDCKSVILKKDGILNEEWNLFLKKWIAMETHLNLEHELSYREIEELRELVLHDIPHEVVDEGVKRVLKIRFNQTEEISGGIDTRRIDGRTATFFVYRKSGTFRFVMSVH